MKLKRKYLTPEDKRYKSWLRGDRYGPVPSEVVKPWLEELVERVGTKVEAASIIGCDESLIRMAITGKRKAISHHYAELIAIACGKSLDLSEMTSVDGMDGWSPAGRFCGDGLAVFDGCGTWFHEHHASGLCEECYDREVRGVGPSEPRDVRMARSVRS